MSAEKEQAILEVKRILKLHFDSFVVTTRETDDTNRDQINTHWHGTLSDVIGLNRISSVRMEDVARKNCAEPEIK